MGALHIIRDFDAVWNRQYNLLDTETGKVVLDRGVNEITRLQVVPGRTFFLVRHYENMNDNGTHLLDEHGKSVFRNEYSDISVWQEPETDKPCILIVTVPGKGRMLVDAKENPLTDFYGQIENLRCHCGPYIKVTSREDTISYITYPDFRRVTPLWFEGRCNDDKRWQKFRGNKDFVSIVKYKGRYQALMRNGSLIKA